MPNVDVDRAPDLWPYPVNVDQLVYRLPQATPSVSSPALHEKTDAERDAKPVARLVVDMRLLRGKKLMAEDDAQFGPVGLDLMDEVRAKWPE